MHGTAVTRSTKFRLTKFRLLDRLRIDITPYIPTQPSVSPITQSEALQMARRVYGEQSRQIFPRTITSELVSTTRRDRPWYWPWALMLLLVRDYATFDYAK